MGRRCYHSGFVCGGREAEIKPHLLGLCLFPAVYACIFKTRVGKNSFCPALVQVPVMPFEQAGVLQRRPRIWLRLRADRSIICSSVMAGTLTAFLRPFAFPVLPALLASAS